MTKPYLLTKISGFPKRKKVLALLAPVLVGLLISGYFMSTAFGAPEEVLNGDGSMDTSLQAAAWTLADKVGSGSWELDESVYHLGTGSGKLSSPAGADVTFDSYVFYRFSTTRKPVSAEIQLAYKKQFTNAQPATGNWNVEAEIWEVGETAPLETVQIDSGMDNMDFTTLTKTLSSIIKYNTQYELRLVQRGQTGSDPAAQLITWFDEVKLNITYDSTPPQVVTASAVTDHNVNVMFDEEVDSLSAQNTANYTISPELNVTGAVLQADGKTVKLTTDTQAKGTDYTVTVNNVQDISLNTMTVSGTQGFTGIDTTPPLVVSVNAVKDNIVTVGFNEQVDSVTAAVYSNYSISPSLTVSGAALSADGRTVELTTSTQTTGTAYTLTVKNIKDSSGNAIAEESSAQFTGVDTTPPKVNSAVSVNETTVDVVFDENVEKSVAESVGNYAVSPSLTVTDVVLQADGRTVRLTTSLQAWQTVYTLTVSNVKDISGNIIVVDNTATFSGTDSTGPRVVSAASVTDRTVDVTFSEGVDAVTSQNTANYGITPGLAVEGAVVQSDGKTVRLTTSLQTYGHTYQITINGLRDLAGNPLSGNNTANFDGVDTTLPSVSSASAISYDMVDVVFGEEVDQVSAQKPENFAISPELTVKTAVLQEDGVTVRLTTPAQTGGAAYTVIVTSVKDKAGNVIGSDNTASFAGISPPVTIPPTVLSATAPDNIGVTLVFSTTMDPATVQVPSNYSISPVLSVTGAVLQKDGVTVKLSTNLQTGDMVYTVTVSNVKDQYGNIIGTTGNSASFTGSNTVTKNPHGRYMSDTNQCSNCHTTHSAKGKGLINQQDQSQLCYLCHDAGGQSEFDVAAQFGKTAPYAVSHHKVPEGTQLCSDCHNPHDAGQDASGNEVHWPRLLQSSADSNVNGSNKFCFSCHQNSMGSTKAIDPSNYAADGTGHNNSSFIINGMTPFNPDSGTGIRCMGCHQTHGSSLVKLLRDKLKPDDQPAKGNDKTLCYNCHTGASTDGRFAGKAVYDNASGNPHALSSSTNTNVSYPGITGQAGQCVNCHDPHGSAYGTSKVSMKSLRAPFNDGKTLYNAADFTLCFGCHNNTSANAKYDIQTPYNSSQGGHYIKSAGGNLVPGSKMPCTSCHDLHGSTNDNKYMLKESLGSGLGDGRNECLACHQTGKVIEGINMSPPSAVVPEHTGTTTACLSCHDSAHAPTVNQ